MTAYCNMKIKYHNNLSHTKPDIKYNQNSCRCTWRRFDCNCFHNFQTCSKLITYKFAQGTKCAQTMKTLEQRQVMPASDVIDVVLVLLLSTLNIFSTCYSHSIKFVQS